MCENMNWRNFINIIAMIVLLVSGTQSFAMQRECVQVFDESSIPKSSCKSGKCNFSNLVFLLNRAIGVQNKKSYEAPAFYFKLNYLLNEAHRLAFKIIESKSRLSSDFKSDLDIEHAKLSKIIAHLKTSGSFFLIPRKSKQQHQLDDIKLEKLTAQVVEMMRDFELKLSNKPNSSSILMGKLSHRLNEIIEPELSEQYRLVDPESLKKGDRKLGIKYKKIFEKSKVDLVSGNAIEVSNWIEESEKALDEQGAVYLMYSKSEVNQRMELTKSLDLSFQNVILVRSKKDGEGNILGYFGRSLRNLENRDGGGDYYFPIDYIQKFGYQLGYFQFYLTRNSFLF